MSCSVKGKIPASPLPGAVWFPNRRGGWVAVEAVISLGILTLLISGLASFQGQIRTANAYQFARQRCAAAAMAQIESIASTGKALTAEEIERFWPDVSVAVERAAGQGDWVGLELVRATAVQAAGAKEVKVSLARYVQPTREGHK